jgi:AmiR/NasT family two-component response regulator
MAFETDRPRSVTSVFVCDDSPAERFLMGQLIKERRNLYLAGAAGSAVGAVQAIEAAQPDVVLLDHLDHNGDVSIIVRADGYVAKAQDPASLWQAIDEVAEPE